MISHPLHSPDLAPCDFFLSPRLEEQWFPDVQEIKTNAVTELIVLTLEPFPEDF